MNLPLCIFIAVDTLINIHMQEDYSKEFEEKKSELQAKVIEIYEASTAEIKVVIYFNNFSHFSNKLKKLKWVMQMIIIH